jgi:hypothetical protein
MPNRKVFFVTDWTITLNELRDDPRTVSYPVLAQALRGNVPVPQEVRNYIAGLFESAKVKKPKGAPTKGNWLEREIDHDLAVTTYRMCLEQAQQSRPPKGTHWGTPYERAIELAVTMLNRDGLVINSASLKKLVQKPHWSKPWKDEDPFAD